jgi:signal transduction histidine kinase
VPIFDIMRGIKVIFLLCLASFLSPIKGEAENQIVLDQSFARALLFESPRGAGAVEPVQSGARGGELHLDFVLDNRSDRNDWVLSAFMASDTSIEILEVVEDKPESKAVFSRTLPFRKELSLGGPYAFRLDLPPKAARQFIVFFSDKRPSLLYLWSGDAYAKYSAQRHLLLGLFYGAILLLVLSQLTASFALRNPSFFWFGLFLLFSSISLCYWDGIAIETFHPAGLPASASLFYFGFASLSMVFGYLFLYRFMDLGKAAPRLGVLVRILACCQAALTIILPWARPNYYLLLVAGMGLVQASIQILGGVLASRRGVQSAGLHIAGFFLQASAALILLVRALGLSVLERLEFAITLFYPSVFASAVFIAIALAIRIRVLGKERLAAVAHSSALQAYFADLSRELMTPMRLLLASIGAQERHAPPSRELSAIRRNADKLARSMDSFLASPRAEPDARIPELAATDLGAVVRSRTAAFSAAAPEGSAGPQLELETGLLVGADLAALERIVDVVLGSILERGAWNEGSRIAVRQAGGRIELWAEMSAAYCVDGDGFNPVDRRLEPEDSFIERGALPDGGSSIRVSLPPALSQERPASARWGDASGETSPARIPGALPIGARTEEGEDRPYLLIVTDEPSQAESLSEGLGREFRVKTAEDAGSALEVLDSGGECGVIVVDLRDGIAEGHEILRLVRSEPRHAGTAFVIAASKEERQGRREVLAEGSVVLLPKPLDIEDTAAAAGDLSKRVAENRRRQEDEYRRRLELILGGLSHAIKNPLSGITGPLALLRRQPKEKLAPEAAKYLNLMEHSAGRITTILRDVGAALFARPLVSEAIDLGGLLGAIAEVIGAAHPLVKIVLDPAEGTQISGDPEAARSVFENIFLNAVEAMDERGEIRVAIVQAVARVVIEVKDSGPGIPQADLGRVFDPFFSTKGIGRGLGLGLAIVRDLAVDMAWEVSVSSVPGQGAAFRISAPRHRRAKSAS